MMALSLSGLLACSNSMKLSKDVQHTLIDENTFRITKVSKDPTYGYSPTNPVEVRSEGSGPQNERRYLNALTGPNGEGVTYFRLQSCCPTKSENALFGDKVLLDEYRVTWEGTSDTVSIYINMYDSGELLAPLGFGFKKN